MVTHHVAPRHSLRRRVSDQARGTGLERAGSSFSGVNAERDRQDGRFGVCAERSFDAPATVTFEHEVLDQPPTLRTSAVGRDIETEREQRAVHQADHWGTRTLPDFDSHQFGASLLEANLRLSDHGESKPAGRE